MKTILHTLIVIAAFLIQTSSVQGQYTYQSAVRISGIVPVNTDSNVVLQAGIGTGSATVITQPVWMVLGFCGSGLIQSQFNAWGGGGFSLGTLNVVIYGPFTDTINLVSKLINANIDTVLTRTNISGVESVSFPIFNYQRGDIYVALLMSTTEIYKVDGVCSSPSIAELDTAFCPFCNSRLSELYQPICTVTFDSASQKNKIIFTKDIFTPAQDYVVFRENTVGTYDTVGFQSVSQLSEYIDATSSPIAKSYKYRLGIRDSCGQFYNSNVLSSPYSNTITTTHLIAYSTGNNSAGLLWNENSYSPPYLIYRTDPSGITTLIDSIGYMSGGNESYTDINAPAGICSYQIGAYINPPCVASVMPSYTLVKSNPGYVTVTGINELTDLSKAISIEPNPFNQFTKIDLHLFNKQNTKVVLRNLTGQVVMQFDNVKTEELIIERNNLSQGLYFLEVTGDGFYARKKVVVE